ncbi:MAG: DUF998 domain-containing protein [Flaviflexus sp.]|nr:DUF998 domain-containing protein [Flaviflexus sp.]
MKQYLAAGLLTCGGLIYASALWEALAGYPINPAISFLSELAARDQPDGWIFRVTDAVSGTLIVLGTLLLMLGRPRWGRLRWILTCALTLTGIGTVLDAASPMDCAESVPQCHERVTEGSVSIFHHLHIATSTVAATGIVIAALSYLAILAHRRDLVSRLEAATAAAASILLLSLSVQGLLGLVGSPHGWAQRLQVLATAMFIMSIAWQLARWSRVDFPHDLVEFPLGDPTRPGYTAAGLRGAGGAPERAGTQLVGPSRHSARH